MLLPENVCKNRFIRAVPELIIIVKADMLMGGHRRTVAERFELCRQDGFVTGTSAQALSL